MKAVRTQLMVNFDGTLQPLTARQRLFYTDRQHLLESKLGKARSKAQEICTMVSEIELGDESVKDVALMRRYATPIRT